MHRLVPRYLSLIVGLAVAITPLVVSAAPPAAQTTDAATRIDTYLRGRMPHLRIPGLSVVVVEGDQVILSRGYGVADRAAGTPMTEDTPVAIASTSKGMTALGIMQLVEQGLVDLEAPVIRYVPEFTMNDARAADITVRQVLTHTAGIPAGGSTDSAQDDQALERRIASLASTELHFAPGGGYEYANDGYSVAGLVVQRVSGVPYEDYLAAHLFEPLGMLRTTFDVSLASEWGLAGYGKSRGVVSAGPVPLSRGGNPAGGVLTTARDVGHYLVAMLNDGTFEGTQVITSASIDQMWTPEPASGNEAYGLGWNEMNLSGLRLLSHAGDLAAGAGYGSSGSQFLLAPDRHLGIAVLANMSSLEKAEIAQDTLAILLGGEPAARPARSDWRQSTFAPDRTVWASYVGEYQTSDGSIRVYREGDRLLGAGGGVTIEFVPLSGTQFVMLSDVSTLDEEPVEFERHADGSVVLVLFGRPLAVKR
jgi:CubicO group peptidase (beta-lactamase class C family)